jgi:Flp pilus assembly protein TadG
LTAIGASAQRFAARFARRDDGATAIEFAVVAVPFFGFMLLIIQVGLYHFSLQSLDFATRTAGRKIMTGQVSTAITSAGAFKTQLLCPNVLWGLSCEKLIVNAYRVTKSSDAGTSSGVYAFINAQQKAMNAPQEDPKQQSFCLGAPGDYIFLDVAYPYPNFLGALLKADADATTLMRSTTFVFNEPFKTASASGKC